MKRGWVHPAPLLKALLLRLPPARGSAACGSPPARAAPPPTTTRPAETAPPSLRVSERLASSARRPATHSHAAASGPAHHQHAPPRHLILRHKVDQAADHLRGTGRGGGVRAALWRRARGGRACQGEAAPPRPPARHPARPAPSCPGACRRPACQREPRPTCRGWPSPRSISSRYSASALGWRPTCRKHHGRREERERAAGRLTSCRRSAAALGSRPTCDRSVGWSAAV